MTVPSPAAAGPAADDAGSGRRRCRLAPPTVATDDLVLAAPPDATPPPPPPLRARVLPLVMVTATVAMTVLFVTSGAASTRNPMTLMFPVMMLVSMAGMLVGAGVGARSDLDGERRDYGRHLAGIAERAEAVAAQQTAALGWVHPEPATLWTFAGHHRMAERGAGDPDFLEVRVGTGPQRLAAALVVPATDSTDDVDPVGAMWLRHLVAAHATVDDAPVAVALRGLGTVAVQGTGARDLARAVVCQIATLHDPADVAVVAVLTEATRARWDWLKWLPHHRRDDVSDACGTGRLTVSGAAAAAAVLDGLTDRAHVVVLVDTGDEPEGPVAAPPARTATTVLRIGGIPPGDTRPTLRLLTGPGRLAVGHPELPDEVVGVPDGLSIGDATMCARRLARHATAAATPAVPGVVTSGPTSWPQLMGIADVGTLGAAGTCGDTGWVDRDGAQRLRVPIGLREDGTPLHLDLKEAAEGGAGPHGLCIGATGSGKSELLRTLVLGLIAGHPPSAVNLVLVDFKGGATFLGLDRAPHVAAVITNLSDEAHLLARMKDALAGELTRRQEVLRAAGVGSVADYDRARAAGAPLTPLPALVVVVDEFSELLHQQPDVAELFVAIGRLGRSLRVHLLLASQRLDEGRLRGLETHLSYRLCLKTFSAHESRAVIGVPDAHTLSGGPGAAYLRSADGELIAFRAAYVSGGLPRRGESDPAVGVPTAPPPRTVVRFAATPVGVPTARRTASAPRPAPGPAPMPRPASAGRSLLDTVLDRVATRGPRAHAVWLPPLTAPPPLDALPGGGGLRVSVGLVDRPFEQRRDPLTLDLSGAAGNVAVVGAPQSGKSTALRTLVAALARHHRPDEVQCYCLDFGGGSLTTLAPLPHVGAVAGRGDVDLARRTVTTLAALVRHRERLFRRLRIDSAAEYRRHRAEGTVGDDDGWVDRHGEVFLLVDGWATLRRDHEALEASVTELAATGLSFGVHVVVTATRWGELRAALTDQLGTRIELRLGEASDSVLDRRAAAQVPAAAPGSGITATGHQLRLALPRDDGRADTAGLPEALAALGERLRARWPDRTAEPVRLLAARVPAADLPHGTTPTAVVLGLDEDDLAPAWLDFAAAPHLVVLGDNGCGKTATLRRICRALVDGHEPSEVSLWIVDVRRTLLGVVDGPHLGGYLPSPSACEAALPDLLSTLRGRLPGPDVTQTQLRDRSWWAGPEVYVVVDDHDLVAGAAADPLAPLVGLLPHAADIGLHLVVARRSGGAARAMYDPLLARMRELGGAGLLMSCGPDEGVLLAGVRPAPLPPGRATLVRRPGDTAVVQVAWEPPP